MAKKVYLDGIKCLPTYGGSLEGRPPKGVMLDACRRYAEEAFGDHRPVVLSGEYPDDRLPEWLYIAWFHSFESKDPSADGTHLVVYWMSNRLPTEGFGMDEILSTVDWDAHAKDFWY